MLKLRVNMSSCACHHHRSSPTLLLAGPDTAKNKIRTLIGNPTEERLIHAYIMEPERQLQEGW